jgi:hypothetical protein
VRPLASFLSAAFFLMVLAANARLVAVKVNCSESRGKVPIIGAISQPGPGGTVRVSETASHSMTSPSRHFSKLQYEFKRQRNPSPSPSAKRRSLAVPGRSICQMCVLREKL